MGITDTVEGYFTIRGGEFTDAGSSATEIKGALRRIGVSDETARRAAVSTFEAEMNVIIHGVAGTLHYEVKDDRLHITITDMGPGIPDVEKAMQAGFSTAPDWARQKGWGSGLGLPNIKNNCDELIIDTVIGGGPTLKIMLELNLQGKGQEDAG